MSLPDSLGSGVPGHACACGLYINQAGIIFAELDIPPPPDKERNLSHSISGMQTQTWLTLSLPVVHEVFKKFKTSRSCTTWECRAKQMLELSYK
eukprot:528366-Pelagomonas_calceolata.AAC.1